MSFSSVQKSWDGKESKYSIQFVHIKTNCSHISTKLKSSEIGQNLQTIFDDVCSQFLKGNILAGLVFPGRKAAASVYGALIACPNAQLTVA